MTLAAGTRLGPYEILAPIGKGGMGEVYRARDRKLERDIAVKVLPEEFALDEERVARFEREAKLLASLNHPSIASIHGFEESDGVKALVLELVEGPTLAERITEGPIAVDEAVAIAKQIAEALDAGHQAGVVHRDLKPANIKVKDDGVVKVLDYGLAKAFERDAEANAGAALSQSPTLTRQGTQVGVLLGTASYMSPEQAKGMRVDQRTDIWAFGAVVYEMLTGARTFPGEDVSEVLAAVLRAEPNWGLLPSDVPRGLRRLLRRCLVKDRSKRLRDIGDARLELEDMDDASDDGPSVPTRAGRTLVIMALVSAMAIGAAVWSFLSRGGRAEPSVTYATLKLEGALSRDHPSLALSPDGRRLAYATNGDLYVRGLDEPGAERYEIEGGASYPFFSPDGQWVGFRSHFRLMKIAANGSEPVELAASTDAVGASWSESGDIFFTEGREIWRVSEGGDPDPWTSPDPERREKNYKLPETLPGGRAVLATLGTADITSWDDGKIMALPLDGGEARLVIDGGTNPRYSPSGHIVYARGGALYAVPFDVATLETVGAPVRVVDGVVTNPINGAAVFDVAEDGTLAYAEGEAWASGRRIVTVNREGNVSLVGSVDRIADVVPSPDGTRLLVWVAGATDQLWVYELERSSFTRLTFGWDNTSGVWSPDGQAIAFNSSRAAPEWGVFFARVDAIEDAKLLLRDPGYPTPTSFAPDGELLAVEVLDPDTGSDIWLVSTRDGVEPTAFLTTPFDEMHAVFSPDGRFLAYTSNESGRPDVYIRSLDPPGKRWHVTPEGGYRPHWAPSGKELFFLSDNHMMAVDIDADVELEVGRPRELFLLPDRPTSTTGVDLSNYGVAPDGQSFYMVQRGEAERSPVELHLVLNWAEELKRLVPIDK